MFRKKEFVRLLGIMSEAKHCEKCNQDVRFQIVYGRSWLVVLFIPLLPLNRSYYLDCPSCNMRTKIEKTKAREYLQIAAKERKDHTKQYSHSSRKLK